MTRAVRRSLYCSPLDWARLSERAQEAGMSVSAFLMACALQDDEGGVPDTRLVLTADEQERLLDTVMELDHVSRAMTEKLPGADISLFGALAFLCREDEDGGKDAAGP